MQEKTKNPEMGARARARRESLGLSKIKLASILDVGTGRLSQMEQDGVEGLSTITRWANALGIDPQDLAFGTPELDAAAQGKRVIGRLRGGGLVTDTSKSRNQAAPKKKARRA